MKTLLFVDDEPRVRQGLQRQLHTMRHEWNMHFVDGGTNALSIMDTSPPDVIVTDMMMPAMDGAQLLTEVMKRHPRTIRIVLSGHADRESVLRLVGPAHQYLSKPCDADELRNAIARAFRLQDLLSSEPLKQLATRLRSLPTLPALHAQLTEELRKEEPSMERVAEIVARDIGMTTKILQLVNSAFFGLPRGISNAQEAVMYLGLTTVRALVLSIQVFSQFTRSPLPGFSIDALAQHCWMTGSFARRIAQGEHSAAKIDDQCFLAGLLHDVGQLILACGLPADYARVLEESSLGKRSASEAEQEYFGATHAELGAYLLGIWGLPNPVIEAVALHHRVEEVGFEKFSPVVAVHAADLIAHEMANPQDPAVKAGIHAGELASPGYASRFAEWRERCREMFD